MKRTPLVLGVGVLTLGILLVVPAMRATESPEVDTNGNATGESFARDEGARISLLSQRSENFSLGAVTESLLRLLRRIH